MIDCIATSDVFKSVFKGLKALVSEARFRFDENGLKVRAVDPANVAMVIVEVPAHSFEAYKVEKNEVVIGVDINRVDDFIKTVKNGEMVDFVANNETLKLRNKSVEYSVALIDPSAIRKEPKVPQLDLPARIVMDAGEFKKFINLADKFADHVIFESDERFSITVEGDLDSLKLELGDAELIEFNKQQARSLFSLEYLKEFVKIAGKGDLLTIKLGTNYPVSMAFDLCDGKCKVEYILAPRIEAE